MEEHFVGYLLGSLDPVTHARVESHLARHPEARARLALLETALAPLADDADDLTPPPGLALATLARIAEHRAVPIPTPVPTPRWDRPVPPGGVLRRIDWIVAAALLVLVGGVALPFAARSWLTHDRVACGNNLRQFWVALAAYGDRTDGQFPQVAPEGARSIAGIFVPVLTDCGLAQDVSIGCPGHGRRDPLAVRVADLDRLYTHSPDEYRSLARELSGDYAYCLGYRENGQFKGLRQDSAGGLPILADRAGMTGSNSANHHGAGQNVLYVGGHVRWAVQPTVGEDCDHIYVNHLNRIQAGVCRSDSVLGAGDARPWASEFGN